MTLTESKPYTLTYQGRYLLKHRPNGEIHNPFYQIPTIAAQREFLLACELGGGNANNAYTITLDQELTGLLQPDALHKAAQRVVDRHEMLRANLSDDGNQLVIKRNAHVEWTFLDLSDRDTEQQATFIEKEIQERTDRVFDLKNRSEKRSVGKACVSTGKMWWWQ